MSFIDSWVSGKQVWAQTAQSRAASNREIDDVQWLNYIMQTLPLRTCGAIQAGLACAHFLEQDFDRVDGYGCNVTGKAARSCKR
jgi:hypothetical protein